MKPYDETEVGKLIRFITSEGWKQGKILDGEVADGIFLGYTVWVEAEQANYVRVKQHETGFWETVPVRLT